MDNWQNGLILILIAIFIIGYCLWKIQKRQEKRRSERQDERENIENEKKIEKIALLNKLIVSDILKYYIIPSCSICLSESFVLIQMGSLGNSVRTVCKMCGSKKWIKTEDRNKNLSFIYNRYKDLFKLEGETRHFSDIELNTNIREDAKSQGIKYLRKPIPKDIQDRVWNRDGGMCVQCGTKEKLEFDHIIPLSKGGGNTYRNIQLLCENCNRSKGDKIG